MHLLEYTLCNLSELCKKENEEISALLLNLASATHYEYGPSDDIVENSEDTLTLLNKYVDELPVDLNKSRLKNEVRTLYTEAQDLDI